MQQQHSTTTTTATTDQDQHSTMQLSLQLALGFVSNTCAYWRWWHFSFSHGHKQSLHLLQLALLIFFLPPTGAHTPLSLEQLALCGGGHAQCSTSKPKSSTVFGARVNHRLYKATKRWHNGQVCGKGVMTIM